MNKSESQVLIITGMHRSGTSLTASLLQSAGLDIGQNLMGSSEGNIKGHFEDLDFVHFHENVLRSQGISTEGWTLEKSLKVQEQFIPEARELINKRKGKIWGWKDPRTTLFLDFWAEHIPEAKFLLIYRSPSEVVDSLYRRGDQVFLKNPNFAVNIWLNYNQNILNFYQKNAEKSILVNIENIISNFSLVQEKIVSKLDIKLKEHQGEKIYDATIFKKELSNSHRPYLIKTYFPEVVELYQKLNEQSEVKNNCLNDEFLNDEIQLKTWVCQDWLDIKREKKEQKKLINQLWETQNQLWETQNQLWNTKSELWETQNQLSNTKSELQKTQMELKENELQLRDSERQLGEIKEQVSYYQGSLSTITTKILAMESSKFWKLRVFWFKIKQFFGFSKNDLLTSYQPKLNNINKNQNQKTQKSKTDKQTLIKQLDNQQKKILIEIENSYQKTGSDLIIFPVIDWEFRIQRPQQLAKKLAQIGYRIFYLKTTFSTENEELGFKLIESPAPNVFIIQLFCPYPQPIIYQDLMQEKQQEIWLNAINNLREIGKFRQCISLINHPFWRSLAQVISGNLIVYDCMDHHAGFSDNSSLMIKEEELLLNNADLVITTSARLSEKIKSKAENILIRNAAEVGFFAKSPINLSYQKKGKKVVGYFGAISEWFDLELVIECAKNFSEWDFVLIGSTAGCNINKAEKVNNIYFLGEVPYLDLPSYVYSFDVCLIPFKINELTNCTNPVKVYEYLSTGKPVVATAMPELLLISDQVYIGENQTKFIEQLKLAMNESEPELLAEKRRQWAKQHNWLERAKELDKNLKSLYPKVSVIVLTYNNLDFTKACLVSLEKFTQYPNWELIIVDNASSDGTQIYLKNYEKKNPNVRVIYNEENFGFAAGNNVGLKVATGDYLIILNNDTFVTQGWLNDLIRPLRKYPNLGLVGPVTNNIGNEAKINIVYSNMEEMAERSQDYKIKHNRELMYVNNLGFFCVATRRDVYEKVGLICEDFKLGFFEDDDYCNRVHLAGYQIAIIEDVFVHHHLSASFDKLSQEKRQKLFEENKKIYESKWGKWTPHKYRSLDII